MAAGDAPSQPPPNTDKIIPFSIPSKVPIKLDLKKHNYNCWSSFSLIHLGSLGLKSHVEDDTASTNPDWCQLDDLIKMCILSSLCDSLQEQVVTTPGTMTVNEYCTKIRSMAYRLKNLGCDVSDKNLVMYTVNGFDSRFATLVDIIRHRETLPSFETTRTMLLLKESSFKDDTRTSSTFDGSSSSPTALVTSTSSTRKGDLYSVTKPSPLPTAFVTTSSSIWHQRLGHPRDDVLHTLSTPNFISCDKTKTSHVCHACQLGKHVKGYQEKDKIGSKPDKNGKRGEAEQMPSCNSIVRAFASLGHDLAFSIWTETSTSCLVLVFCRLCNSGWVLSQSLQYFSFYLQQGSQSSTGLFLSQKKYACELLERANMVNCNPSRTPVDTDSKLGPEGVAV
nr:hypothetical protein [Tanacetum cinerariifolium]